MFHHVSVDRVLPELRQINEEGSRFYQTPEGKKYPSVTTVLSEYSKQGILEWRKRVGNEEANKISNKASTRGTKLHKYCETYLKNEVPSFSTPIEIERFNRFKPILHNINYIYALEQRMYSDHLRLAGTVDVIGQYDGKLSVIDIKTSSKLKKEEYIENYFIQCSAYAIMFEELFNIPISQIVVAISVEEEEPQVFIKKRDGYVKQLLYYRDLYEKKYLK